jgi:hypothetical protein
MHHDLQLAIRVSNDRRSAVITDADRRRLAGRTQNTPSTMPEPGRSQAVGTLIGGGHLSATGHCEPGVRA